MRIFNIFKDALFPLVCTRCGRLFHVGHSGRNPFEAPVQNGLDALFRDLMSPYLCRECSRRFVAAESPICTRCGLIFKSRQGEDHLCGECLGAEKPFGIARAAGVYDQSLMAVIHAYKYGGKVHMAKPLSRLIAAVYERNWHGGTIDWVIPVPLHPLRHRSRGFNQAYLIARPWNKSVVRDVLQRRRPTAPQTGLGRKERLSNIRGAFAVRNPSVVDNKRILLVDDVYTTGATGIECARMLLKNGAAKVDILTVARAVK